MIRLDDRSANQIRTLSASLGLLSRSDGSAKFSLGTLSNRSSPGSTSVLAGVYGPLKTKDEQLDACSIHFQIDPLVGHPGLLERMHASFLSRLFEKIVLGHLFPRTGIRIVVQVMQDDGAVSARLLMIGPECMRKRRVFGVAGCRNSHERCGGSHFSHGRSGRASHVGSYFGRRKRMHVHAHARLYQGRRGDGGFDWPIFHFRGMFSKKKLTKSINNCINSVSWDH